MMGYLRRHQPHEGHHSILRSSGRQHGRGATGENPLGRHRSVITFFFYFGALVQKKHLEISAQLKTPPVMSSETYTSPSDISENAATKVENSDSDAQYAIQPPSTLAPPPPTGGPPAPVAPSTVSNINPFQVPTGARIYYDIPTISPTMPKLPGPPGAYNTTTPSSLPNNGYPSSIEPVAPHPYASPPT